MTNNRRRLMLRQAAGGGPTVYMEHDFTASTSGTLATVSPDVDELGLGWVGQASGFAFQGDGTGVMCTLTSADGAAVQTDGRVDVRVTATFVMARGAADGRYTSIMIRGTSGSNSDGLNIRADTAAADLDLFDPFVTTPGTWNLTALMTSPPVNDDEVTLVVDCEGNDITLVSVAVNGGTPEVLNSTITLTSTTATAHGAGSGADYYGISSYERIGTATTERHSYIKVESLP